MKELGYRIFAILYRIFCIFPVSSKKVFLVMTHDSGPESNVAAMRDYIKKCNKEYYFVTLTRKDTEFGHSIRKMCHFFLADAYHFATSSYIFLDNMFLPMAYIKRRPKVKVVQLWHGTGVIKKIGSDVNTGKLKELEYLANQNNTHLMVSSEITRQIYARSFSMPMDKVYITGMPRTDVFFDSNYRRKAVEAFYEQYPKLRDKKIILYAPTFRDSQVDHPVVQLDYTYLSEQLDQECVLGLRLHPFVAKNRDKTKKLPDNVIDFSYFKSLNTLLFVTDLLISDYSSIIYEFSTLKRPMLFYAYDLEQFEKEGRGFYWDYEQYVPGPVVTTTKEVEQNIKILLDDEKKGYKRQLEQFYKDTFYYRDNNASGRIYELLEM